MLKAAAAQIWNVPVTAVTATLGVVTLNGKSISLTYGQLAASAATQPTPAGPPLMGQRPIFGRSMPRADLTRQGQWLGGLRASNVSVGSMVYASVLNCPVFGGTLPAGRVARDAGWLHRRGRAGATR